MSLTVIVGIIIISIILYKLYKWNNRPVYWSVEEVIQLLESVLVDDADYNQWDYFEACAIKDPRLEEIRQESLNIYLDGSLYLKGTAKPYELLLSEKGKDKVKVLISKCIVIREHNNIVT